MGMGCDIEQWQTSGNLTECECPDGYFHDALVYQFYDCGLQRGWLFLIHICSVGFNLPLFVFLARESRRSSRVSTLTYRVLTKTSVFSGSAVVYSISSLTELSTEPVPSSLWHLVIFGFLVASLVSTLGAFASLGLATLGLKAVLPRGRKHSYFFRLSNISGREMVYELHLPIVFCAVFVVVLGVAHSDVMDSVATSNLVTAYAMLLCGIVINYYLLLNMSLLTRLLEAIATQPLVSGKRPSTGGRRRLSVTGLISSMTPGRRGSIASTVYPSLPEGFVTDDPSSMGKSEPTNDSAMALPSNLTELQKTSIHPDDNGEVNEEEEGEGEGNEEEDERQTIGFKPIESYCIAPLESLFEEEAQDFNGSSAYTSMRRSPRASLRSSRTGRSSQKFHSSKLNSSVKLTSSKMNGGASGNNLLMVGRNSRSSMVGRQSSRSSKFGRQSSRTNSHLGRQASNKGSIARAPSSKMSQMSFKATDNSGDTPNTFVRLNSKKSSQGFKSILGGSSVFSSFLISSHYPTDDVPPAQGAGEDLNTAPVATDWSVENSQGSAASFISTDYQLGSHHIPSSMMMNSHVSEVDEEENSSDDDDIGAEADMNDIAHPAVQPPVNDTSKESISTENMDIVPPTRSTEPTAIPTTAVTNTMTVATTVATTEISKKESGRSLVSKKSFTNRLNMASKAVLNKTKDDKTPTGTSTKIDAKRSMVSVVRSVKNTSIATSKLAHMTKIRKIAAKFAKLRRAFLLAMILISCFAGLSSLIVFADPLATFPGFGHMLGIIVLVAPFALTRGLLSLLHRQVQNANIIGNRKPSKFSMRMTMTKRLTQTFKRSPTMARPSFNKAATFR